MQIGVTLMAVGQLMLTLMQGLMKLLKNYQCEMVICLC